MMAVLSHHITICMDTIGKEDRPKVEKELQEGELEVMVMSLEEMENFACNTLCLQGSGDKEVVVMSKKAYSSLQSTHKQQMEKTYRLVVPDLGIIEEVGGGSARCMIGELF